MARSILIPGEATSSDATLAFKMVNSSLEKLGPGSIAFIFPDLQWTRRANFSAFGYTTSLSAVLRALP